MRSTKVSPAGFVWSKKPSLTMSTEWPWAALASLALAFSAGRPAWARTWLCRQRIAALTSGRFVALGVMSVFAQVSAARAFGLVALTVLTRLSPRAIVATGSLCLGLAASAAGVARSRPAVIAAAGISRVK